MTGRSKRPGSFHGSDLGDRHRGKRTRPNAQPTKLGDVMCILELGGTPDAYQPAPRSIFLSKLGAAALPSCPWSYPLRSLYETLGLASEDTQVVQIHADFNGRAYAITDAGDWLDMLHEIWEQETDELYESELRLTVSFPATDGGRPEERLEVPREGNWFIEKAARTDDDWDACCRFMRHSPDRAGEGQGKVLMGTKIRLSKEEMLDVHRYLRRIAVGRIGGMVFSCHGSRSALRVQLAIMSCIRLCGTSYGRNTQMLAPGADCPHNHPLGIECACQPESLTRKLGRRVYKRPMAVVAQSGGLTALAAAAGQFFIRETRTGTGEILTPTVLSKIDGSTLRDAITEQLLCEIPVLLPKHVPYLPHPYGWDHIVVFMTPIQATQWLVGGGDLGGRPGRNPTVLPIAHLYIHDWAPTPYFKPELLLGTVVGRDTLINPRLRTSFSITTPVCTKLEWEAIEPLARLCSLPDEEAPTDKAPWLVRREITYRRAEPRERWWAPVRVTKRAVGRVSELPTKLLRSLAERVRSLEAEGSAWALGTLFQHRTIQDGVAVELLRAAGLLPPITSLWAPAWRLAHGEPMTPELRRWVRDLDCCHLTAFAALLRELRGNQTSQGYMLLLVPEPVLAAVLSIWINQKMAQEFFAAWTGPGSNGASQQMLDVVFRRKEAESKSIEGPTTTKVHVIVASPGSIDGYRHQLAHFNWVVCFGEPWKLSELNSVVETLLDGTCADRYDELQIIWIESSSDSIGLGLASSRQG